MADIPILSLSYSQTQHLNEQCATQFDSGDQMEALQGLDLMKELVVPYIGLFNLPTASPEDTMAIEEIRGRWCSYLGQEVSGECLLGNNTE